MYGNVAIMYGGGQIPSANIVLGKLAEELLKRKFTNVFCVHKSFMGLADSNCYEHFTFQKAIEIQHQIGTYLSTCRKVNPAGDEWYLKIKWNLQLKRIKTLVIAGGDGSSRAGKDLVKRLKTDGIDLNIIFIPCTIDGIAGSDTIGIDSAVEESKCQAKLIMANAFATWNPNFKGPRVAVIEMQGRNRNDIAVKVMRQIIQEGTIGSYSVEDINLIFVPTAYKWSFKSLLNDIESTEKETAVIISEGAEPIEENWKKLTGNSIGEKIANVIKENKVRDVNLNLVGYLSQTNDRISDDEILKIQNWVNFAVKVINMTNDSLAIIQSNGNFETMSLDAFASNTESKEGIPLTEDEVSEFKKYLP